MTNMGEIESGELFLPNWHARTDNNKHPSHIIQYSDSIPQDSQDNTYFTFNSIATGNSNRSLVSQHKHKKEKFIKIRLVKSTINPVLNGNNKYLNSKKASNNLIHLISPNHPTKKHSHVIYGLNLFLHVNHLLITTIFKLCILDYYNSAGSSTIYINLGILNFLHVLALTINFYLSNNFYPMEGVLMVTRTLCYILFLSYKKFNFITENKQNAKNCLLIFSTIYLLLFNIQLWIENKDPNNLDNLYRLFITELAILSFLFHYFYWEKNSKKKFIFKDTYGIHLPLTILFVNTIICQTLSNITISQKTNKIFKISFIASGCVSIVLYSIFAIQDPENIFINPDIVLYPCFFITESLFPMGQNQAVPRLKNICMIQIPMIISFLNIPHTKIIGEGIHSLIKDQNKHQLSRTKMEKFLLMLSIFSTIVIIWRNEEKYVGLISFFLVLFQILDAMNIKTALDHYLKKPQSNDGIISKTKRILTAIPPLFTFIQYVKEYK